VIIVNQLVLFRKDLYRRSYNCNFHRMKVCITFHIGAHIQHLSATALAASIEGGILAKEIISSTVTLLINRNFFLVQNSPRSYLKLDAGHVCWGRMSVLQHSRHVNIVFRGGP
jgi:hypothetical protein